MLTDIQKEQIVEQYSPTASKDFKTSRYQYTGFTMDQLAKLYSVSRRTIARVLLEAGKIQPQNRVTPAEMAMVRLLRNYGMKVQSLHDLLDTLKEKP